jgi:hypothetical protein
MGENTPRISLLRFTLHSTLIFTTISKGTEVEKRLDELRASLDLPQIINRFMKHMLITLLISTIAFATAIVLQND